jgi:hypothetical protein
MVWATFWAIFSQTIPEVAHIFGHFFPLLWLDINFDKEMGRAAFWAIFSQTHLVTLLLSSISIAKRRTFDFVSKNLIKNSFSAFSANYVRHDSPMNRTIPVIKNVWVFCG